MTIGPFQFRDVHKGDKDADPFELVGQMFRQIRDIVDQINKAPFTSDNVLRRVVCVPTQAAADERPIFILPDSFTSMQLVSANLSLRLALAAGTVFTITRYAPTAFFPIGTYDTTTNGAITAINRKLFALKGEEKCLLGKGEILTLSITGNVPSEGLIVLDMLEVFP